MYRLTIKNATSLAEIREHVRALIAANASPGSVDWTTQAENTLFGEALPPAPHNSQFTVPAAYVELARDVLRHRDPQRFALLYELL